MSLQKTIKNRWDKRAHTGKNFQTVAKALKGKDQAGLTKFFNRIHGYMDSAGIKTGQTLDVRVTACLPTSEEKEYKCQNCGKKGLKHATRLTYSVNDTPLLPKDVGESFGNECFGIVTYIAEAAKHKDFEMPKKDEKTRQENLERYNKVTLTADQLDKKAIRKLKQAGIDPTKTRIPADKADAIQKAIARGDLSVLDGIKGCNDLVGWGVREFNNITDENVKYTAALFATKQFNKVTPEQWNEFKLYAWQYRKVGAAEEISDLKDDIEYWQEISKKTPEHLDKLVKKYETIDLKKQLIPIKLFDKAEWEDISLETLLYNRQEITKAQSRALRRTIPRLERRRIEHNSKTIEQYCSTKEFKTILKNLETKYAEVKSVFAAAYAAGTKEPDNAWKNSYKRLKKAFFETKEKVERTGDTISLREIVLKYTPMRKADQTARTLYTEGKKLELAKTQREEILRREYTILNADIAKLDKLLNGALELDKPTREGRNRIEKTAMSAGTIRKLIEDIKESAQHGIIQTKYIQAEKNKTSILERALELTADYELDDGSTAKNINYLRQLEQELGVKIANVRAEDGRTATRKSDARLKTSTYASKKYFSKEQKQALSTMLSSFAFPSELKNLDVQKTKETIERVKKFYQENNLITNYVQTRKRWNYGSPDNVEFRKAELPENTGMAIQSPPVKWYQEEDKKIQEGRYKKASAETKKKLEVLLTERARKHLGGSVYMPSGKELEETLSNPKTLLSDQLAKAIDNKYSAFAQHVQEIRQNRKMLSANGYDVEMMIEKLQKLKRKKTNVNIPSQYGYTYSRTDIDDAIKYLKQDYKLDREYVKKLHEAIKPAQFVVKEGRHLYNDTRMTHFDFVATCDLKDADKNEHRLRSAFGKKRNQGKSMMLWTPEEREIGSERLLPNTWYGTDRTRDYFDKICARAEKMGNIYIRITDARP